MAKAPIIKKAVNLLPTIFRTDKNSKFLSCTIDQLTATPKLDRIDGFAGSKLSKQYNPLTDTYFTESNKLRQAYQLEPALIVKELDNSIKRAFGFDDLINQLEYHGANVSNLDSLFRPKYNSYNPHIDWDKFINFREYYWMPNGPNPVQVSGVQQPTVSTYSVTDSTDGNFFVLTPDGLTVNPLLTLYKGVTYVFNVNSSHTFYIKTEQLPGVDSVYTDNISGNGTANGQIILTVDTNTPSLLYYSASDIGTAYGQIVVKNITENSSINVDLDIVGKSQYTTANGIEFINGLVVNFGGKVVPEKYSSGDYLVEGVGTAIKLIDFSTLTTPDNIATLFDDKFDEQIFDDFPFDSEKNIPLIPEYITVNKSSMDQNPWSRYNRWFHSDVLRTSALANNVEPIYSNNLRAARPIIEFTANLQLWNFGTVAIDGVDLIDTVTTDAFSIVEGSAGYYVDGILLQDSQRVIFTADQDPLVSNKIYRVSITDVNGHQTINLIEDSTVTNGNNTVILSGTTYRGTEWFFNGDNWIFSQQRTVRNQAPLFDLFDSSGLSYSNINAHRTDFNGNKVFGYSVGTGVVDNVLGFSLNYKNIGVSGTYLFENYFNTSVISEADSNTTSLIPTYQTYLKTNVTVDSGKFDTVWEQTETYKLPATQLSVITNVTNTVEVTVFDNPANISDLEVSVLVNNVKKYINIDYTLDTVLSKLYVKFINDINGSVSPATVLIKCISSASPNSTAVYETPINLTNNPLNGLIASFTLSEIEDHVKSMVDRSVDFVGKFPGVSNLKSLPNITKFGTRLISNQNPLAFSHCFITNPEHSLINSIRKSANDYYQFKLNLVKTVSAIGGNYTPAEIIDQAIELMTTNKNSNFLYALSDMAGYGQNLSTYTYTVSNVWTDTYSIASTFNSNKLSNRAVYVYVNNELKTLGIDYEFDLYSAGVIFLYKLSIGDTIQIKDYVSTDGSYIPPTPTKLGLFPKYQPLIYVDNSFASGPTKVIQGHDGSITVAFSKYNQENDYRDLALLEYETRVFNNIKTEYKSDILPIASVIPGLFRKTENSISSVTNLVQSDFLKWASTYGLDFATNYTYNVDNYKTYNFKSASDSIFNQPVPGSWRAIYKFYFDTERPDVCPWEMLGFSIKPIWWDSEYGAAPYTSGNELLWADLEAGLIRQGDRKGVDQLYSRPGLSQVIPVDDSGNIVDIRTWANLSQNDSILDTSQDWAFGDIGPVESAWRKSSLWPFASQIILALSKPADYAAMMFDTSRLVKDNSNIYKYSTTGSFISLTQLELHSDIDDLGNIVRAAGFSVWVIENGKLRTPDYLTRLKSEIKTADFNLLYKTSGFLSKDKVELIIDSINPTTVNPGVLLPSEDYSLHFNISNPVKTVSISGIVVEKSNGQFVVKGYDKQNPYFNVHLPEYNTKSNSITIGGKSETFLSWTASTFYYAGQIVQYSSRYYRVVSNHNSGISFNLSNYISLPSLPVVGGVSVLSTSNFSDSITTVPYGTRYSTLQEVYDLIIGYGAALESIGFVFGEYNTNLEQVIDWKFSGKEFLFWSTQNWTNGSVITLSPFADSISYKFTDSVVDNVFDNFYEYSLLKADGQPFPPKNFSLSREDGTCSIKTTNTTSGLFFARLNLVQKEHAIVLNNTSMFNDIIYDVDTGYRQLRIKLTGFKTASWNGAFNSPGFIYDNAQIANWEPFRDYKVASVVKYAGKYYSAKRNINGTESFDFDKVYTWDILGEKPVAQLLPNFDYQINQFEDFYSLDIDNFDSAQQKMAQHLIGYTPRTYLDNIFVNPIAQYKFYQGFIKEKGTKNAIDKLAKASMHNLHGHIEYNEEWAFRVGEYGNFTSYNEVEFPLRESDFKETSQLVKFVDTKPALSSVTTLYVTPDDIVIKSSNYNSNSVFSTSDSTFITNDLILPNAGYVLMDDITATAYNYGSLLDIANNGSIKEGNTVWLGFKDNGDWDVYRYTNQLSVITNSEILVPGASIVFKCNTFHKLSVGDIVSVYGLDNGTDGIYKVTEIDSLTSFVVSSTLSTLADSTTTALLFKFLSVRLSQFDDITNLQSSIKFKTGDLVWVDSGTTGKWEVYQKSENFQSINFTNTALQISQKFGNSITSSKDSTLVAVSSPNYVSSISGYGRVFVYGIDNGATYDIVNYGINSVLNEHVSSTAITNFGQSLVYDDQTGVIYAGAPLVNLVKVSSINKEFGTETTVGILTDPTLSAFSQYGYSLCVSSEISPTLGKNVLIVGAPAAGNQAGDNNGSVYAYALTSTGTIDSTISIPVTSTIGDKFGTSVSLNINGQTLAVSSPGENNKGSVSIYTLDGNSFVLSQTINAPLLVSAFANFGTTVKLSANSEHLVVTSTTSIDVTLGNGTVFVYKLTNGQYVLNQTITSPISNSPLMFGSSVSINDTSDELIISALGDTSLHTLMFDNNKTTFDSETCEFTDLIKGAGSVFVFNRYNDKFVYADELINSSVNANSNYGYSVSTANDVIFVSAPDYNNVGTVYLFSKIDKNVKSWNLLRQETDLVDISKLKRAITIDSVSEKVVDYLDIIDPIKGKIAGIADQEIRYKTAFDPAVYSIGTQGVVVNTTTSWIDAHLGDLWWDLSTVKYVWYEQDSLEYRKNTWGELFPGASIDVYEWVKSEYLPSQWSALADTAEGLAIGISGQPKYADNSVISVKQYFNANTASTTNVYYFWVKNTVLVPNVNTRKISASDVASIIFDPTAYGIKTLSVIGENAVVVNNVQDSVIGNTTYLNIAKDDINSVVNQHTEWLLLEENSATSMPTTMLDKKLIDSLLGKDSLGNSVPDINLSNRNKYGISIRPRQTMFKDRLAALRNVIEYTNSVLATTSYVISDIVDFTNLNSKETIADIRPADYDTVLDSINDLDLMVTHNIHPAVIECAVSNGKIISVTIVNSGNGYLVAPSVTIANNSTAEILTQIDESGKVVNTIISNPGTGFITAPSIVVRPFSVVVQIDSTSANQWALYQLVGSAWVKTRTQNFDTTKYWDYIDSVLKTTYDSLKPLAATVGQLYELATLAVTVGNYVKVKNQGNGRYIILERVELGGTFNNEFDLVYCEKGSIKFKDTIWTTANSPYNFDYISSFDQTLYDQAPQQEIANILTAIKNDIFVGPLKLHWNVLFFKSVKYALSEQKFIDWAFKTSFINVRNIAGTLDQRSVYKFQNSKYYEDYIKEVKPYHTQIRNFQVNYDVADNSSAYSTDFDLPAVYNTATSSFVTVDLQSTMLGTYPLKSWNDNYKFSVGSIVITNAGFGYTKTPTVEIISASGDTGSGATAIAYLSITSVLEIVVTNSGSGYTKTPTVLIVGGAPTTTATAYAQLKNDKVRSLSTTLRFDRVSALSEINSRQASDSFECDGSTSIFKLTWAAEHKKADIEIAINGITVFANDYSLETYTSMFNGYHKKYSNISLTTLPEKGSVLTVSYNKNIELYNAAERINEFYSPTVGMDGKDLSQLMTGVEYSGNQIHTLPFSSSAKWDVLPFTETEWASDIANFHTLEISQNVLAGTDTAIMTSVSSIVIGQNANVTSLNSTSNKFSTINEVTVLNINTSTNSVTFTSMFVENLVAGVDSIEFWTKISSSTSLDQVIDGGDLAYTTATGINPSEVIVDGDVFLSPTVCYAPEELIPGTVNESVGISVFTQATDLSVIGFRIFKDMLNRTHYKRLSAANTTTLTSKLYSTSTTITVSDASVLPIPDSLTNQPGIILVSGERIEYMTVSGNTLGQLKRATLGTGAKDSYEIGTSVVDQGASQTIPYQDTVKTQTIIATTATSYILHGFIFNETCDYTDQIEVYYGGKLLHKPKLVRTHHNSDIAYDSGETNSQGVLSDELLSPEFNVTNDGESIILNISILTAIIPGVHISVIYKTAKDWYDSNSSLTTDTSIQAVFLQEKPAQLPA